jgi:hypothetical protein
MMVKRLAGITLKKNFYSSIMTGLVFAGFGAKELFPSLLSFSFEGKVFGRQKIREDNNVSIDTEDIRADIIPFAQREMVDRFLYGVDPSYEEAMLDNIREGMDTIRTTVFNALPRMYKVKRDDLSRKMDEALGTIVDDLRQMTLNELKERSKSDTVDAVSIMAKSDLASFAEALVQITSIKRRASLDIESVGGPIDVAVISKDDGFVWVKRKHYFDPDLNPRYFFRKYGSVTSTNRRRDK